MISILLNINMKEIPWKKMSIHISLGYRYLIFKKIFAYDQEKNW